jgi:predicted site-specific integrase-resolvase
MVSDVVQLSTGTILVEERVEEKKKNVAIYARVSNQNRRKELEYQVDRLKQYATINGYDGVTVYKEVASGMNDNRTQLWKMIDSNPTHIIIENKDRLTRFGFHYLERLLRKQTCEIIIMHNNDNDEADLMKDLVSIITSFCCRLYGLRRGQNKAKLLKDELNK